MQIITKVRKSFGKLKISVFYPLYKEFYIWNNRVVLKSKNKTVFIFKERLLHTLVCMQDDLKPTQHMHQTHPLLGLE